MHFHSVNKLLEKVIRARRHLEDLHTEVSESAWGQGEAENTYIVQALEEITAAADLLQKAKDNIAGART